MLTAGPLHDAKVGAVVARLEASRRPMRGGGPRHDAAADRDPHAYAEVGFPSIPSRAT
jgi:hypothetical protein